MLNDKEEIKQCEFLHSTGKRCRKKSALKLKLHLNDELYNSPCWVEVNLCVEHYLHFGGTFNVKRQRQSII